MALPGMTEDVADAILDWIDEDEEPREYGAEADIIPACSLPYAPRNATPETVEELLLVRGVMPELLFGVDVNRNGMQDVNEMSGAAGECGLGHGNDDRTTKHDDTGSTLFGAGRRI